MHACVYRIYAVIFELPAARQAYGIVRDSLAGLAPMQALNDVFFCIAICSKLISTNMQS